MRIHLVFRLPGPTLLGFLVLTLIGIGQSLRAAAPADGDQNPGAETPATTVPPGTAEQPDHAAAVGADDAADAGTDAAADPPALLDTGPSPDLMPPDWVATRRERAEAAYRRFLETRVPLPGERAADPDDPK